MENIRQVLEDAAQTFLSAANTITNERRREAEKVGGTSHFEYRFIGRISLAGFSSISSFPILLRFISVSNRTFFLQLRGLSNLNRSSRRYRQRMVVTR